MSPIFSHNFSIPVHCCPSDCGLLLTLLRDIRAVSADHQGRGPLILIPWPTENISEVLRQLQSYNLSGETRKVETDRVAVGTFSGEGLSPGFQERSPWSRAGSQDLSSQSLCFAKQTQGSPYQATIRDYKKLPQLPSGNSFHPVQTRV